MNEVQLIRGQLTLERQHASEVVRSLAERVAIESFRSIAADYLAWVLSRFEERDQVFHDLLRTRFPAEDPDRRAAEDALALPGSSRETLIKLQTALDSSDAGAWQEFQHFFSGAWSTRRDEIDRLFERQAKVTDWRTVSDIDADSIVDERGRYARVNAARP